MKRQSVLGSTNHILRRIVYPLSKIVNSLGTIVLLGMMFITTADVISRYFLNYPIPGTFELVELMLAVVVFFGLAYTATQKGHIIVELLFVMLPRRAQAAMAVCTMFLSIGIFVVALLGIIQLIRVQFETHAVSSVLVIPIYPFTIAMAFGISLLCLVLLTEMISCLIEGPER